MNILDEAIFILNSNITSNKIWVKYDLIGLTKEQNKKFHSDYRKKNKNLRKAVRILKQHIKEE